jgi:hypothetical protein
MVKVSTVVQLGKHKPTTIMARNPMAFCIVGLDAVMGL